MKKLLTGNEAIARGAYEAGATFASAYPGTPSTEILESLAKYSDIAAEWAPNEKVAVEAAIGASLGGARCITSMKHVGVNVAADPLFTFAYTGVNGGMVLVTADEPGQHSSQNEQDNRNYAKFSKIALLEPADSQECKDMTALAFTLSEQFDTPVMIRSTTRVSHSKSIVECGTRQQVPARTYQKNIHKYVPVPVHSRKLRLQVEERLHQMAEYAESTQLNRIEYQSDSKVGVIASGMCYYYAREVFGQTASYLKLGFTNPLPRRKLTEFCSRVDVVCIVEENDPFIEEEVERLGFGEKIRGKNCLPPSGEMTPDVLRKAFFNQTLPALTADTDDVLPRPPALCAGCPHRGVFYALGRRKDLIVAGDIGCYSLGYDAPYNAMDFSFCMGASFSAGHGLQKVLDTESNNQRRVVGILGDSTFFHTGINSLLEVVYNNSRTICVILDNSITAMTGHQNNPGNGLNAKGEIANATSIETVVRAIGIQHLWIVNPNQLDEVDHALDQALDLDVPSVIIARYPCALKRLSEAEKQAYQNPFTKHCYVEAETCIGCRACLRCGCPALAFDRRTKKAYIDPVQCVGCTICAQICPKQAIQTEGRDQA